jgi:type I restriction enzyme S subunit
MSEAAATPFHELYRRINAKDKQILSTEILAQGDLPVVDQGKSLIAGYTNNLTKRFVPPEGGVIVFGDHTRVVKFADFDFAIGADGTQLIAARGENDTKYLAFLLSSQEIPNTGYNRHFKFLKEMTFAVPSRNEQQAIAAALSDADGVVAGLERVIAKKRLIKQGAMQDLLTARRRLPGFSGEWEMKRLGEFGRTYGGLTGKSKQDFGIGKDSYIEFMDVMQNTTITAGEFPKVRLISGERQNRVQRNDLLFNGSSETPEEVGLCAAVLSDLEDTYLNSFCFGYRLHESNQVYPAFLASLIRSGEGRERIKHLAQGATRYNLSKRALLELELPLPSFQEQQAIAAVLSDMDAEIQALEARLTKARAVKEGMMQNLLTGRVRLV